LPLSKAVSTGITFEERIPGVVNEYIQREAARFALYRWGDFEALPVSERNRIIAHYRGNRLIEMHESEAIGEDIERRSRSNGRPMRVTGSAR
jgi:hypothetical protein